MPSLDADGGEQFARDVLDRFANPSIEHALIGITLQGTMKMRVRVVPSIVAHVKKTGRVPQALAFGFAAWLRFMKGDLHEDRRRAGLPVAEDSQRDAVQAHWSRASTGSNDASGSVVRAVLRDAALWGTDLAAVPGLEEAVRAHLARIERDGVLPALDTVLAADAARA